MTMFVLSCSVAFAVALGVTLWVLRTPKPKPVTRLVAPRNSNYRLRASFFDAHGVYHHQYLFLSFRHFGDCWPDCDNVKVDGFVVPLRSREEVYGE